MSLQHSLIIDPGIDSMGVCLPGRDLLFSIKSKSKDSFMDKVNRIISELRNYINDFSVTKIYIEDYAFGAGAKNSKGFLRLAELKGILYYYFNVRKIEVETIPIQTWKKATIGFKVKKSGKTAEQRKSNREGYLSACSALAGFKIKDIDKADAYMMYLYLRGKSDN